jgi:hypothetical protein
MSGFRKAGALHGLGRDYSDNFRRVGLFHVGSLQVGCVLSPSKIVCGNFGDGGKLTGNGYSIDTAGLLVIGRFVNGELQGLGLTHTPQRSYVGAFHNSSPHGPGVYTFGNTATRGEWVHGHLTRVQELVLALAEGTEGTEGTESELPSDLFEALQVVHSADSESLQERVRRLRRLRERFPERYTPGQMVNLNVSIPPLQFHISGVVYKPPTCKRVRGMVLFPDGHPYSHFSGALDPDLEHPHGKGLLYKEDGTRVSATWVHGHPRAGKAVIRYVNRNRFTGTVNDALEPLSGTMLSPCGRIYKGFFNKKLPHGAGTLICRNGTVIKGIWFFGNIHGMGTLVFKPGQWIGVFQYANGRPIRNGIVRTSDGRLCKVSFEDGQVTNFQTLGNGFILACTLEDAKHNLIRLSTQIKQDNGLPTEPPGAFKLHIRQTTNLITVVNIEYIASAKVQGYFVRISSADGLTLLQVVNSETTRFVLPDLAPAQYYILAGVVRRKNTLVPLTSKVVSINTSYSDVFRLCRKRQLNTTQTKQAVAGSFPDARLYNINDFNRFAYDAVTSSGSVGFHEASSTFVVV